MRPPHPLGLVFLFTFVGGFLIPLMPVPTHAQPLPVGRWTGEIIGPEGQAEVVTYDVTNAHDTLAIRLTSAKFGSFTFDNVVLKGEVLTFGWEPGTRLECLLVRQRDGRYEGTCEDIQGTSGQMRMQPPLSEAHE